MTAVKVLFTVLTVHQIYSLVCLINILNELMLILEYLLFLLYFKIGLIDMFMLKDSSIRPDKTKNYCKEIYPNQVSLLYNIVLFKDLRFKFKF